MDSLDLTRPNWLPAEAQGLTEATSRSLMAAMRSIDLLTPASSQPIRSSFAYQGSQGQTIVMLHGFDSSCLEFRRLLPRLAEENRVWAVDLLGFGFCDRPGDLQVSPQTICEHLYAFWQAEVREPMVLIGASMGGAAAVEFALAYPEAVEKLVLLDSAGLTRGPNLSKVLIQPLGNLATTFLSQPWVRVKVSQKAYQDQSFVTEDANLCASLHLQMPNWSGALITFTRSGGYYVGDRVSQVGQPTLILWGRQDRILGTKDASKFVAAIGQSQLQWVENCGHVPHLEKPEETAAAIGAFIA
jgi:pimeloyl-ACP methyl ester carboxylesterase